MGSEQIFLWLDEPKYRAVQRILKERGTDLETVMQARLEAYYREVVPVAEQEQINMALEAERLAEEQTREANRRMTVYRIREGGGETLFESELCLSPGRSAARLRACLKGGRVGGAGIYADKPEQIRPIDGALFEERTSAFRAGDERVCGVLDVDMDAGSFAVLDRDRGWLRYSIKDVSSAAYHAYRRDGRSERRAMSIFQEKLQGKELPAPTRRLTEQDVSFADGIEEIDGKLNFYMEVVFDVDTVLGTHVCTTDNGDWLNLYANYDLRKRQVCDELDVILHRQDGRSEELSYKLSAEEKEILLGKMEAYCLTHDSMTLEQCRAEALGEQVPAPELGMGPLQ